jgi:hypothetical protein
LSCENFQTKCIIQKNFLFLAFNQKDLQKVIKSFSNWIQVLARIHFYSLYCHQGISVPGMALELRSLVPISLYFSLAHSIYRTATPHMSRSHLHVKHSRCTYSRPYNPPIISSSAMHHSFPPYSIAFKRSSICSTYQI